MVKPLFYSLISEASGYVYTIRFKLVPLDSDVILPPFTSKLVKQLVLTHPCFSQVKALYESRVSLKPVTFKVLRRGSRRLYKSEGGPILTARMGEVLSGEIAVFSRRPDLDLGLLSECNSRISLPPLTSSFLLEVVEATLENVNTMTLGLDQSQFLGVRLHTPTLLSTKLMTPPHLRPSKLVRRLEDLYRLTITPAYICSAATTLWLALVKDINPAQSPTPYHVGRACDITIGEVDVQLKPETVTYDREEGRTKRVRGVTGYIVYKILTPRITQTLDKILAPATRLGIGKSRSIGFGEIEVKPKPPKEA
jgi:hypothetical protein